ncbi:MAG: hypothetical protein KBA87_03640 [Lachnospiraceae bacterium]|jgi:hypothetical protein|nr:hypothetical protein [Lachnospiraceae bacterium]
MSGINISNNSWNNWTSSSIQTLFAGFSTSGVNNLASLTNDYSSIKNGSYGKLVKAYYDKEDSSSTKKTSSQDKINQLAKDATTQNTKQENQVVSDAKSLENSVDKLEKTGSSSLFTKSYSVSDNSYDYNTDKIFSAVSDFVNSYNNLISSTDKLDSSSNDTNVSNMLNATRINSKTFDKIGITVGSDSKLSVNKDLFKKSNMSDVQSLFQGSGSYGSTISNQAESISGRITGTTGYDSNGKYSATNFGDIFSSYV